MKVETFPQALLEKAQRWGSKRVAQREKDFGIWLEYTWAEYLEHVRNFALGLLELGLQPGEKVAILGDNEPEWVWAELGTQVAGGVPIGIYQTSIADEVQYLLEYGDVVFVVAEDQEQVDKILEIKEQVPLLRKVIYWDPKGMRHYRDPLLLPFQEVEERGQHRHRRDPEEFVRRVEAGREEDLAVMLTTSGTTARPKLVMLSHRNMLRMAANLLKVDPMTPEDEFLSFLPLAWVGEQMMSLSCALTVGFTVNFPEEPETVQENLREIGPHVIFSPPRVWESLVSRVQVKIEDSTPFKRWIYKTFMPIGYRMAEHKFNKTQPSLWERFLYWWADLLLFSPIKDQLGLLRVRKAYSGGAALGPDVFRFFHALGVNLKQIYGQTEISGISVVHRDDDIVFHTVGQPIPETEIRISEEGEILSRSPSVFMGYYKRPEDTAEALEGGWLHSGDAGYLEENGHLVVIDRLKDVMRLADGQLFSPQYLENKLKFSPYIKEAMAIGQDRPYVVAILNIDRDVVGNWAERQQLTFTTYPDLAQKPQVYELIAAEVARINQELPPAARVRRFVLLHKEFDPDDGEMTRTRKLRRGFIHERYADLIAALYDEGTDRYRIRSRIRYQDGTETEVEYDLRIYTLNPDGSLPEPTAVAEEVAP